MDLRRGGRRFFTLQKEQNLIATMKNANQPENGRETEQKRKENVSETAKRKEKNGGKKFCGIPGRINKKTTPLGEAMLQSKKPKQEAE